MLRCLKTPCDSVTLTCSWVRMRVRAPACVHARCTKEHARARCMRVLDNPLATNITSVNGALVSMQPQKCAQTSTGLRTPTQLYVQDRKREEPVREREVEFIRVNN